VNLWKVESEWKACNVSSGIIINKKSPETAVGWAGHVKQSFICRLVSQCIMCLGKDCIEPSKKRFQSCSRCDDFPL